MQQKTQMEIFWFKSLHYPTRGEGVQSFAKQNLVGQALLACPVLFGTAKKHNAFAPVSPSSVLKNKFWK